MSQTTSTEQTISVSGRTHGETWTYLYDGASTIRRVGVPAGMGGALAPGSSLANLREHLVGRTLYCGHDREPRTVESVSYSSGTGAYHAWAVDERGYGSHVRVLPR